jgi:DNA-binding response OmpR family regulator
MEQQLLIADADGYLSDLYLKYFAAHGYSVRVASGGVECLKALRETPPDVLVLDTELKWGGADGVLAVMDEEDGLSKIPIVLLNDMDGKQPGDPISLAWTITPTDATPGENMPFVWPSALERDVTGLYCLDENSTPSLSSNPNKRALTAQVVDRLLKPFRFQNLLDSIGTATARPRHPR